MTPRGTDFLTSEVAAPAVPPVADSPMATVPVTDLPVTDLPVAAPPSAAVPPAGVPRDGLRPVCRVFPGHAAQVPHARRFVRRVLAAGVFAAGGPLSDAVLLTSELAANAVQHTASGQRGHFAVIVWPCPTAVRICVTDSGSVAGPGARTDPGRLAAPDLLADSGRGLMIVAALASRWGQQAGPEGRVVWFELDIPPANGSCS